MDADRFESEETAAEFDRLVLALEGRLDHLADEGLEAMRGRVPRWISETGPVWRQLGECIRGTLRTEWSSFRDGVLPGRLPDIDATLVVMASRLGDLASLMAGYRFAQMALWGSWFELIEASVVSEGVRRELLRHGSQYFFQYADLVSRYMAEGYQRGVERAAADGEHHRFQAMKILFEADPLTRFHFDIEVHQHHLGLVAWGEGADHEVRALADDLDRRAYLTLRMHNTWWGWLSGSAPLDADGWDRLRDLRPRPGVRLAFGLEGSGEAGFRATNHQALRAQWVASSEPAVVHYEDVAIEALASEAEGDARAFVAHELHGIDDASAASERLRMTLGAYLDTGFNAASTAAAIGVHQQTVANRLRTIEERLGHSIAARQLELAVALRLRAALTRVES